MDWTFQQATITPTQPPQKPCRVGTAHRSTPATITPTQTPQKLCRVGTAHRSTSATITSTQTPQKDERQTNSAPISPKETRPQVAP